MYDIDPPSPILRLSAPRKAYDAGGVFLNAPRKATQLIALSDKQHLAQLHAGSGVAARHREALGRLAQADPWTVRHSVTKASGADILVFRSSGAVERLRTLSEADADLSGALNAAL